MLLITVPALVAIKQHIFGENIGVVLEFKFDVERKDLYIINYCSEPLLYVLWYFNRILTAKVYISRILRNLDLWT